jgi:predicted TIM-barrel fold metal-dependent hydrolase
MAPRASSRLIDFHSHYYNAAWYPSSSLQGPANLLRAWPLLTNIQVQLADMDDAGIDAKVLTAPSSVLLAPGQPLPISLMQRINDHFAELANVYPECLLALATIDAFHGDIAAREVERAVQILGIPGICVDCARGDRYLDAPEARPALEAAAALGVAVFVHPVSPVGLTERLARLGHTGVLLARGTETAASVLALLRSGILDDLPNLRIVIPMISAAALLFAGIANEDYPRDGWQGGPPGEARKRLYVDTMGYDPASIRFAVELLGVEHVLNGSDWPIMPIASRQRVEETLSAVGLTGDQQAAIMRDNVLRLLTPKA